jgi:hypothetical protein
MALIHRPRRLGLPLFRDELEIDDPDVLRIGIDKMANYGLLNGAMGIPMG